MNLYRCLCFHARSRHTKLRCVQPLIIFHLQICSFSSISAGNRNVYDMIGSIGHRRLPSDGVSAARGFYPRWILYCFLGILLLYISMATWLLPNHISWNNSKIDFDVLNDMIRTEVGEQTRHIEHNIVHSEDRVYPPTKKLAEGHKLRILITGGAGFIGSHLTDRLMRDGHHVFVMDNFFTGRQVNVQKWVGHPHFQLINHDVVEPIMLEVDYIYHLACPASPTHYQYNPIKTIKTNTEGTLNALGLAKRVKARIMLASSSEVYGDPQVDPQKEGYWGYVNPVGKRACYDEGKRVAETMMYAYQKQSKVDVRVARIFNTFGPRMRPDDGRVVSTFILQALQGNPLTIHGDGEQVRSYQYVDDLVSGLVLLMQSGHQGPVNLGNPDVMRVKELAKLVIKLANSTSVISFTSLQGQDDTRQRRPDISVAREALGWRPKVSVIDGLRSTIEYFRQEMEMSGGVLSGSGAFREKIEKP